MVRGDEDQTKPGEQLSQEELQSVSGGLELGTSSTETQRDNKKKGNVEYGWKVEEGE